MIYVSAGLNPFLIFKRASFAFPLDRKGVLLFGFGRTALEYALRIADCEEGEEILLPDYICDVVMSPCNKLKMKAKFYRVDNNFAPDLDNAKKLLTSKSKVFVCVNYFGFPQPFNEIKKFCSEHELLFIEDNAHGYFSKVGKRFLGTFGDMSIFSFRKTLPVKDGAALLVSEEKLREKLPVKTELKEESVSFMWYLKRMARWIDMELNIPLYFLRKEKIFPGHGFYEDEEKEAKISLFSFFLLRRINMEEEAKKRRENYKKWVSYLRKFPDVKIIFEKLPLGVIPMAVPVYVKDKAKWLMWGKEKKIELRNWPGLPRWVSENLPSAVDRYNRLLLFPVTKYKR